MIKATYELNPVHDSVLSFYRKAMVTIYDDDSACLFSYGTKAAIIDADKTPHILNMSSATTLRHVKEFLKQYGFKAENKKQIYKDYAKEEAI